MVVKKELPSSQGHWAVQIFKFLLVFGHDCNDAVGSVSPKVWVSDMVIYNRTPLTFQRRSTFKFLPSPWTEEFKFPTSSAPSSIRGIDPCMGAFNLLSHALFLSYQTASDFSLLIKYCPFRV